MRLPILIIVLLAVSFSESAFAGPLDGSYISNKNNRMQISATRYVYSPRANTTNPKNVRSSGAVRNVGGNRYKFSGGNLKYTCTLGGSTLDCGHRIWTRQ